MESRLKCLLPNLPVCKYGKDRKSMPLRESLKNYWQLPECIRIDLVRPTKENDTYFNEMINLKLKELDYDKRKIAWEYIQSL